MSTQNHPRTPTWARAIFFTYLIIGALYSLLGLFVWFMGPCPAFSSNANCYWSPLRTYWIFPGQQIAFLISCYILLKTLRRLTAK
jgi:hypothetical protein